MATPIDPTASGPGASRVEELRERLRPRGVAEQGATQIPAGERFALERVQALELQLSAAYQRERELTELAVRDGNEIATLELRVHELAERADRAEAAERALFEAENRAETEARRAELMETELASTRAEVDRLRRRVVELEASLRRALAEVGAASAARSRADRADVDQETARLEAAAERSLELADRLRLKVVDLESSLRSVIHEVGDATAVRLRAEQADAELAVAERAAGESTDTGSQTAEAEARLADLEERLASLDDRISGLSSDSSAVRDATDDEDILVVDEPEDDTVVDLREAEEAAPEPAQPPASRWSQWRAT